MYIDSTSSDNFELDGFYTREEKLTKTSSSLDTLDISSLRHHMKIASNWSEKPSPMKAQKYDNVTIENSQAFQIQSVALPSLSTWDEVPVVYNSSGKILEQSEIFPNNSIGHLMLAEVHGHVGVSASADDEGTFSAKAEVEITNTEDKNDTGFSAGLSVEVSRDSEGNTQAEVRAGGKLSF